MPEPDWQAVAQALYDALAPMSRDAEIAVEKYEEALYAENQLAKQRVGEEPERSVHHAPETINVAGVIENAISFGDGRVYVRTGPKSTTFRLRDSLVGEEG